MNETSVVAVLCRRSGVRLLTDLLRAQYQYLKDAGTQFLFEPAVTVRGGYDFLKAQFQVGRSYNVTNSNFKQEDNIVSLGVVFTFKRD